MYFFQLSKAHGKTRLKYSIIAPWEKIGRPPTPVNLPSVTTNYQLKENKFFWKTSPNFDNLNNSLHREHGQSGGKMGKNPKIDRTACSMIFTNWLDNITWVKISTKPMKMSSDTWAQLFFAFFSWIVELFTDFDEYIRDDFDEKKRSLCSSHIWFTVNSIFY